MSPRDLEALATRTAESLWREIVNAFALVRTSLILKALERHILERDIAAAVQQVGLEELANAMARVQLEIAPVRQGGWDLALADLPKPLRTNPLLKETLGAHAIRQPQMLEVIRRQDLSRIRGITLETQQAIRDVLTAGLEKGTHPTVLARQIRSQVGLTRQGVVTVAKYRALLESQSRKPDQVERMVAKKVRVLTNARARTIAQTETARAQVEGAQLQWERMVADGVIQPDQYEQEYRTSHLENTCPVCRPMDGQRAPIGQPFLSAQGPVKGPPLHPLCACNVILTPKDFRKGQPTAPARDAILKGLGLLGAP